MIVLRAASWKIPAYVLSSERVDPVDSTISGIYGAAIFEISKAFVKASFDSPKDVPLEFSSNGVTLKTGGIPYFSDAPFLDLHSKSGSHLAKFEMRVGNSTIHRDVEHVTGGIFFNSVLCAFMQTAVQIEHIEEKAKREGHGLGTKERFQLESAKSEFARIGARAVVWKDASDSPMLLSSSGLTVRAGPYYSGWQPLVKVSTGSGSGLSSIVASHKAAVKGFYLKLYPSASAEDIEQALKDADLDDWYNEDFRTYVIPTRLSTTLPKPPLLISLEALPREEMAGLAMQYLLQTVPKALSVNELTALHDEYCLALKRKGHKSSRAKLLEGRLALKAALLHGTGVDTDVDLANVITGSYRWSEFAKTSTVAEAAEHPLLWETCSYDDGLLIGRTVSGTDVSLSLPSFLEDFAVLLNENKNALIQLLIGWENFVASTYSASFSGFYNTKTVYQLKSFRPVLQSCGVIGSMMPNDVIGVLE